MTSCDLDSLDKITDVNSYTVILIVFLFYICFIKIIFDYLYAKYPSLVVFIVIVFSLVSIGSVIFVFFQLKNTYDEKKVMKKEWEDQKCDVCELLQHNKYWNFGIGFTLIILLIVLKTIIGGSEKIKNLFFGKYINIVFYYLLVSVFILFIAKQLVNDTSYHRKLECLTCRELGYNETTQIVLSFFLLLFFIPWKYCNNKDSFDLKSTYMILWVLGLVFLVITIIQYTYINYESGIYSFCEYPKTVTSTIVSPFKEQIRYYNVLDASEKPKFNDKNDRSNEHFKRDINTNIKLDNFKIVGKNIKIEDMLDNNDDIPRYVHVIWYQGYRDMRDYMNKELEKTIRINNSFTYVFWDEHTLYKLLLMCCPEYKDTFKSLNRRIKKIDFMKYILMYCIGGFYHDLDIETVSSLDKTYTFIQENNYKIILQKEVHNNTYSEKTFSIMKKQLENRVDDIDLTGLAGKLVTNSFFFSTKEQPYFKSVLDLCKERDYVLLSAGPFVTTYVYETFFKNDPYIYYEREGLYDGGETFNNLYPKNKVFLHKRWCDWCIEDSWIT